MFDTCIKIMFVCDLYYKGPGRWVQTSGSPKLVPCVETDEDSYESIDTEEVESNSEICGKDGTR